MNNVFSKINVNDAKSLVLITILKGYSHAYTTYAD